MSAITKAKKVKPDDLTRDPQVRAVFKMVEENPSGMAVMEIALMECALSALDEVHRSAQSKTLKPKPKGDVKKFYRALAKTGLSDPEHAIEILKHLGGEGGEENHPSGSGQEVHSGGGGGESKPTGPKRPGEKQAEDLDAISEKIFSTIDNPKVKGAVRSFLTESSIGTGVVATAKFFADAGGKFQFAAKAIAEFGPIAGVRLAHTYFRYGGYDVPIKNGRTEMGDKIPTEGGRKGAREWAIERLSKRLPSQQADSAGAEPPSEGFLIDKDGKIVAHAVGRGNDHFLPFNSRHLRKLRQSGGGEYVRRRMFGGPTTEDLHAAMMMGATKVTVVSNGGTFSIDLTSRSHGLKLEHMQVLTRYQEILDNRGSRLNFDGYDSALDSLVAEFPLHFRKTTAQQGAWAGSHDRIGPKDKLSDQIKNLFGILSGDDSSRGDSGTSFGGGRGIGGRRKGETDREALLRQVKANPSARAALMRQYIQIHGENNEFVRSQKRALANEQGRSGGRINEPSSVRTPSTAGESWRDVTERTADVSDFATERARVVQPPGDMGYVNTKGMNNIRDVLKGTGLDTKNPDPQQVNRLKEIATAAANDSAWERMQDDTNFWREMESIFPNIG